MSLIGKNVTVYLDEVNGSATQQVTGTLLSTQDDLITVLNSADSKIYAYPMARLFVIAGQIAQVSQ